MPDWLTHVLFAWALWNFLSLKFNMRYRGIFLAGSLLPDIKNASMLSSVDLEPYLGIFHTPVGALITSGILSTVLFRDGVKQTHIFLALGTGSLFHLLLDLLVSSMDGRVMLFFPASFTSYSLNVFMQEDLTLLYAASLALLVSFIAIRARCKTKA